MSTEVLPVPVRHLPREVLDMNALSPQARQVYEQTLAGLLTDMAPRPGQQVMAEIRADRVAYGYALLKQKDAQHNGTALYWADYVRIAKMFDSDMRALRELTEGTTEIERLAHIQAVRAGTVLVLEAIDKLPIAVEHAETLKLAIAAGADRY